MARPVNDIKQDLARMLYRYYIKYTKMQELVNVSFANANNTKDIDIYVDVYDMLRPIYDFPIYTDKRYVIVSAVINLVAHIRRYFARYHHMGTRIFLVYADDTTNNHKQFCPEFGDDSFKITMNYPANNQLITSQLELVRILAAYINDVYFVRKKTMFPMFTYDNIARFPDKPALVFSRNQYAYQIPAICKNAVLFRPKKHMGEDLSQSVFGDNVLYQYFSNKNIADRTLSYLQSISPEHLGLIMSLVGNARFNLRCIINTSTTIRIIYEAINCGKILNGHMSDPHFIYTCIPELSKYMTADGFLCRYSACDLIYQHLLYSQMSESLDTSWMVNFYDPKTIQHINNTYFADNPLDIESL